MAYTMIVEWGHCDAAGIVFYPNFLRWFDASFQRLLRTHGLDQRLLAERYGILGTALKGCDAKFLRPVSYGDEITMASRIVDWQETAFTAECRIVKDGKVAVVGHEYRFWALKDDETGRLSAGPIPDAFRKLFAADQLASVTTPR